MLYLAGSSARNYSFQFPFLPGKVISCHVIPTRPWGRGPGVTITWGLISWEHRIKHTEICIWLLHLRLILKPLELYFQAAPTESKAVSFLKIYIVQSKETNSPRKSQGSRRWGLKKRGTLLPYCSVKAHSVTPYLPKHAALQHTLPPPILGMGMMLGAQCSP